MKLWEKEVEALEAVVEFTVGEDHQLDRRLVRYDCLASKAHVKGLRKAGLLTSKEERELLAGLDDILELARKGGFQVHRAEEDCHTAIERYLTERLGEVGQKVHTGRSRNDQVLTALRLYEKEALGEVGDLIDKLSGALAKAMGKYGGVPLPGYTHTRRAMPTTVGTWLGSFSEALSDSRRLLATVGELIDRSPLGSAAGFGVPLFELDRDYTARQMGFSGVVENPIYAQCSRGKLHLMVLEALGQVMLDLNRLATDLVLFSGAEFGFVVLPEELCTGSSVMPQKKNPDVLELIRSNYHVVAGEAAKLKGMVGNLISGYHRDIQLSKGPLFTSFEATMACLRMATLVLGTMTIDAERCAEAMTPELYATEEAYRLVKEGLPFREAYRIIGEKYTGPGK